MSAPPWRSGTGKKPQRSILFQVNCRGSPRRSHRRRARCPPIPTAGAARWHRLFVEAAARRGSARADRHDAAHCSGEIPGRSRKATVGAPTGVDGRRRSNHQRQKAGLRSKPEPGPNAAAKKGQYPRLILRSVQTEVHQRAPSVSYRFLPPPVARHLLPAKNRRAPPRLYPQPTGPVGPWWPSLGGATAAVCCCYGAFLHDGSRFWGGNWSHKDFQRTEIGV